MKVRMKMQATLVINNHSIKILSAKGGQVQKWGSLPLGSGLVRDGLILQPQAVGEAIASLFKTTGIPKDRVTTSLGGLSFTYRFINLPRMKPALLDEAILRAAKKEISLSLDELYLSWQLLPGQGEEQPYFVLGVPRNLIDALVTTLKIAGVEPYLVDLQALALARAAGRQEAIVVNVESDSFDIVFITNGMPAVIHTMNAMREGATLEDNIGRLADELTKMAAFYQSRHPESTLNQTTPLLLTGELTAAAPVIGLLQPEIEYPVGMLAPPLDCPPELPVAFYMANMGLALRKIPPKSPTGSGAVFHDININLLSGKYRKPRAKPMRARYLALWIILAVALALLYPLYQNLNQLKAENAGQQTDFSNITREYALAILIGEENAQTDNTIRQIIAGTGALKAANLDLLADRGIYYRDLQLVTGALPPFTNLTSIEIDGDIINVSGETDSVFTVVDYAAALAQKEEFHDVRITELDEEISFVPGDNMSGNMPDSISLITFGISINKRE